ncbi:16S rRNA (uracil(1498)-N(3))-methyltransferase [Siminovitchia sp. 179-K 8D1 HS]|uniref:16S rRNA (uracil(1498)-N(3))-methyltransferase n=1 Tax=Siminovitchia sp. 179-K 8D1 HS TaxID=3142385 RepID=UPI0039A3F6C1
MQRYFMDAPYDGRDTVLLSGDHYHHIANVMRMKPGNEIWVVFNDGLAAKATIISLEDQAVKVRIMEWEERTTELPVHVTVASGLPKGDKWEWVIQKGTELGASQFVPFKAARSVVKWDEKKSARKLARWKKIAMEAAEQSHRQVVPDVLSPMTFEQILALSDNLSRKIVAHEEAAKQGEQSNLANMLAGVKKGEKIIILFGPEGGWEEKEVELLTSNGFISCGLGPRILRTETAPLYALAAISYHFELMG